jgi:protein O-mannosyl-transferase
MKKAGKPRKLTEVAPAETLQARGTWGPHLWRIALLWAVLFASYSNSFEAGLVFDNSPVISEDPRIRAATSENFRLILTGDYWYKNGTSGLYRPLTTLSYLANYALLENGPRPAGYHWINLVLHGLNVSLVYALGMLVFEEPMLALALAAIWGLHPLLTESVTNIVGRADLMAGFGVLAGLLMYARAAAAEGRRKLACLAGLVAAQAVGLFSKESAVVLPGIMLLYDLTWPKRASWRSRAPAYAALVLPFALFYYMRSGVHTHLLINFGENPLVDAGFWTARMTALKVIGKFLWLFLWPARLSADYSYNAIPLFGSAPWEDAKALLALAVCVGAGIFAVRARSHHQPLFFFLLFFFIALSPTSNLIVLIGSIMAERFMYLPSVGLAGCLVVAIHWLAGKVSSKRPSAIQTAWAGTGMICLALGVRTYNRNFDWRDGVSLWSSAIEAYPQAARPHNNLGFALLEIPGRLPDAIAEYQAALRIRPDYVEAHYDLGNALVKAGRLPEAIAEFQAAVRIAPNYADAHNNLGNVLFEAGRLSEAIEQFHIALRIKPDYAEAHNNLGNALMQSGRLSEAAVEFESAARIRPDYAEAHNNLGNALARIPARLPDAAAEYQKALHIRPDYAEAHNNLGNALSQIPGRLPDAIAEFQAALRIRPDYAEAHNNLGGVLLSSGRLADAIAEFQAAVRLRPDLPDAHYNLANAWLQAGRPEDAIAEFEAVQRIRRDPEVQQILGRLRARRQ